MSVRGIHPLIHEICDTIRQEYGEPAPEWTNTVPGKQEMLYIRGEVAEHSDFDQLGLRREVIEAYDEDIYDLAVRECAHGRVLAFVPNENFLKNIPWELWARIMRAFSRHGKLKFTVYFLAHPFRRQFPDGGGPIQPLNINGGYTTPCEGKGIVIYRAEDATRVLIHELFHASCSDNPSVGVDQMEAETEAWAELFYCAFIGRGVPYIVRDWISRQAEWMRQQNEKVGTLIGKTKAFPWRYTIGKQDVWERWGIFTPNSAGPAIRVGESLRLTLEPPVIIKEREGVTKFSDVL
jgi:hypothetical protein